MVAMFQAAYALRARLALPDRSLSLLAYKGSCQIGTSNAQPRLTTGLQTRMHLVQSRLPAVANGRLNSARVPNT